MHLLGAFLSLLALSALAAAEKKISASPGGGIVKPGDDLVLTYDVGAVWDRCYWFWYHNDNDHAHCSFELDPATGTAKLRSCKPEGVQTTMTYTGTDKTKCEVTVSKVAEKDNATYAARTGEDIKRMEINVIVAKEPTKVEVTAKEGQQGSEVTVKAGEAAEFYCSMDGVRPAPAFGLSVKDLADDQIRGKANTTQLVNGAYNVMQTLNMKPSIVDHGKKVECRAQMMDGEGKALFDAPKEAAGLTLNVQFPPEEKAKQTINVPEKTDATVSFVFKANPAPTDVKWIVVSAKEEANSTKANKTEEAGGETPKAESRADEPGKDLTIKPGTNNTKYSASEAIVSDDGLSFRYNLTIRSVTDEDTAKTYRLEVANGIGKAVAYEFAIQNGSGFFPGGIEPSSTGTIFTLLGVAAVIVIILALVSYFKKRRASAETTPLTSR